MASYRISSLDERRGFYAHEFNIRVLGEWFAGSLSRVPQFFAVDFGTETKLSTDSNKIGKIIVLQPHLSLGQLREKLFLYAPEDAYYDTRIYKNVNDCFTCPEHPGFCADCPELAGQELVFDLDPENIDCPHCGKKQFPHFCNYCLGLSLQAGAKLSDALRDMGYHAIRLVYSGRGCHVHVTDPHAMNLSTEERVHLARDLRRFPMDSWVTTTKRLIRLPYSLHALISRIAMPITENDVQRFDAENDARVLPRFLG